MLATLKQLYMSLLILSNIIVGFSVLACVPDDAINTQSNVAVLSVIAETSLDHSYQSLNIVNKPKRHLHSHMGKSSASSSSRLNTDQKNSHKNCKCCEFDGCASCLGCAGACSAVLFSISINNNLPTMPLGLFYQQQNIYASVSPIPLQHPPK